MVGGGVEVDLSLISDDASRQHRGYACIIAASNLRLFSLLTAFCDRNHLHAASNRLYLLFLNGRSSY